MNIDDVLRKEADLRGSPYAPIIDAAHRWSVWAAPKDAGGKFDHNRAII